LAFDVIAVFKVSSNAVSLGMKCPVSCVHVMCQYGMLNVF